MATARTSATSSRSGTKKAPAKKTAARNGTNGARNGTNGARNGTNGTNGTSNGHGANGAATKKVPAMKVARTAAQQLAELTGREPECVVGIQRVDDGWQVELEVVESRRIPDSTDVLATYSVETDEDGDLTGYQRVRRYVRGKGGDGDGGGR